MIFHQIIYHILSILNNERTVSSAFHLLKGKKSGQTIQDVGMYKLHNYFGILPKLDRKTFDEAISWLINQQYITMHEDGFYHINEKRKMEKPNFYFNGWMYRGYDNVFFSRLSLIVESISYVKQGIRHFAPTEKNFEIQRFVRSFLMHHPFREHSFRQQLYNEIESCLSSEKLLEHQQEIVVHHLTGANLPGKTMQQLASEYRSDPMDIHLKFISALHVMLMEIERNNYSILSKVAAKLSVETQLTNTAKVTKQFFDRGYSIDQIANMRNLKVSTIEDHIVEMAMNIPSFSIDSFLSKGDVQKIISASRKYSTKKLRVLKDALPVYSYFQLRLALAKGDE